MFTNEIKDDGFGSQYQSLICAILYAEVKEKSIFVFRAPNLSVVYYPEEIENFNKLINLQDSYLNYQNNSNNTNIQIIDIRKSYTEIENHIDYYLKSESLKKIKSLLRKDIVSFDKNYNNVVIHIRRPSLHKNIDITEHHNNIDVKNQHISNLPSISERFLSDTYYLKIIEHIRKTHKNNKFYIVSEGNLSNFNNFIADDIVLYINKDPCSSFIYLVMSDILVMSKSSFSYSAALLNENIVYYPKDFWHKKASHWIIYE